MERNRLNQLLKKYEEGTCSEEERQAVEQWFWDYEQRKDELPAASEMKPRYNGLFEKITAQVQQEEQPIPVKIPARTGNVILYRWLVAASILLVAGAVVYKLLLADSVKTTAGYQQAQVQQPDVQPGGDKATLQLANGNIIQLDSIQNGTLAMQGGASIIKMADGKLKYVVQNTSTDILYNTISTPRGGNYQVLLPDGSMVWLNASSSLRLPTTFTGSERRVEMTGEVYFEIAKNAEKPFHVIHNDMDVTVLGTHFNVNTYTDEDAAKVTLLEGSVKMSVVSGQSSVLKPGEQAVFTHNSQLTTHKVDLEAAIAWKNNLFWFTNADIKTVMRQIVRWYDVEVVFDGTVTKKFSGTIPKNMNVSKVFTILEQTGGVHFTIDGNKITVKP